MSNPQIPFVVPGPPNDKVEWPGDQKEPDTGFYQSHNGGMKPHKERPQVGKPISDIYQWSEL